MQNRTQRWLLVTMSNRTRENIRKRVAAHRAQQVAAGLVSVNTYMPADLVKEIDRIKEQRGASSRAPLIEEAVRFYIENMRA